MKLEHAHLESQQRAIEANQRKNDVMHALSAFVDQRPGFDLCNYDSMSSYRSDYNPVLREKHDFYQMLSQISWRDSITADDIIKASEHAFSGRLTIRECGDRRVEVEYCTGQYFPTEYRAAACAVLASVLWDYWRSCDAESTGDSIRKTARDNLGRGIASRWFN